LIVTNKFVLLNFPKTGSSFARKVIKDIHGVDSGWKHKLLKIGLGVPKFKELYFEKIYDIKYINKCGVDQHGCFRQIPDEQLDKVIVSIIRNPYSRYVSAYRYGWWKNNPPVDIEEIKEKFPNFPKLSFEEYMKFCLVYSRRGMLKECFESKPIGMYSLLFINFFSRTPSVTIENYLNNGIVDEFSYIKFLKNEDLNNELEYFLCSMGYRDKDLEKVGEIKKQNVSASDGASLEGFYTQELLEFVNKYDDYIFRVFPEYKAKTCGELSKFNHY